MCNSGQSKAVGSVLRNFWINFNGNDLNFGNFAGKMAVYKEKIKNLLKKAKNFNQILVFCEVL